jgi:1,4-dihydroxy-2-naphthoate polyprenyltransferase
MATSEVSMQTEARPVTLQQKVGVWLSATRPKTLPAALAPVLVGSAFAWRDGSFHAPAAWACLAFAILVQIGTNFANDYYDFVKGADTRDRVGPTRAVAAGLIAPKVMHRATAMVFLAAFLVGLTLLRYGGWPLLLVGVSSILCGYAYTGGPFPLGYNGLGDLFVFIFFGLVAVGTTYLVQAGHPTSEVWLGAVAVGCLAANILVANNYRDVETDTKAGKRTTVVRFGKRFARMQFLVAHLVAFAVPIELWRRGHGAPVLVPLVWVYAAARQVQTLKTARTPQELIQLLGSTGRYLALYAATLGLGLVLAQKF